MAKANKENTISVSSDENIEVKTKQEALLEEALSKINALASTVEILQKENEILKNNNHISKTGSEFDRWVTIVHLCERMYPLSTFIKMSNGNEITFYKFGDTASLRYNDFEELVRSHRDLFEQNIICLSDENSDLSEKFNLNKKYTKGLSGSFLDSIHSMSEGELTEIYNKVAQTQKDTIVQKFIGGYYEKDNRYNNKNRAELLNRLSDGKLKAVLEDMDFKKQSK